MYNTKIKPKPFYGFKYDAVFKAVFGDEKNFEYLEGLLSECLDKKVKVIKLIPTEMQIRNVKERKKRLDLLIEADGQKINVEIDTSHDNLTRVRNMNFFYTFCSTHTTIGNKYDIETEFLHISLNYAMSINSPYMSIYEWYDKAHEKALPIKHKYIEVNVEKYGKLWYDKNIKEMKDKKFLTLIGINEEDELEEYVRVVDSKQIKKVVLKVQDLNENEMFIYHISPDEDEEYTRNTYMYMAEKEGKKEGIKEGKKEGMALATLNIAENLLQKNYAIKEIMDVTGLSEEEIKKLQEKTQI